MSIVLMRVDDRLIHGQITCAWASFVNANKIFVVDDKGANDPITRMGIKFARVPGAKCDIFTLKDFVENYKKSPKSDRIMVIVREVETALNLLRNGVKVDWLDVGQLGYKEGRVQVTQTVSVSEEEAKIFSEIAKMGVKVIYRQLPDHSPSDLIKTLKKHFQID
ncbi:MAG: PTS system mannose/fructose/N-acetylgalactosamine-transporter subunit IIB [Candidatus Asgardarchaeia archaeon]